MSSITIRNLDEDLKERLRVEAARAGHSMEEHLRQMIEREVGGKVPASGFGTWLHEQFRGATVDDLPIPARTEPAVPIDLPR
jgi:hypothetical protein